MDNLPKIKSLLRKRKSDSNLPCQNITDLLIKKELLVYYWYLHYSDLGCNNSWSKISSKISDTTPIIIKNCFYSNANSTIRRIVNIKLKFENCAEKMRTAFFLFLSQQYLAIPKLESKDHFQNIVASWNLSKEILSKYAIDANIDWSQAQLLKELHACLQSFTFEDEVDYIDCIPTKLILPMDINKTLKEIGSIKKGYQTTVEEIDSLRYLISFPRVHGSTSCQLVGNILADDYKHNQWN